MASLSSTPSSSQEDKKRKLPSSSTDDGKMSQIKHTKYSPGPASAFVDTKLKPRITSYLEKNKHKEFIDVEGMVTYLYSKYPEYGRKKLRVFRSQVEGVFGRLQDESAKGPQPSNGEAKPSKQERQGQKPSNGEARPSKSERDAPKLSNGEGRSSKSGVGDQQQSEKEGVRSSASETNSPKPSNGEGSTPSKPELNSPKVVSSTNASENREVDVEKLRDRAMEEGVDKETKVPGISMNSTLTNLYDVKSSVARDSEVMIIDGPQSKSRESDVADGKSSVVSLQREISAVRASSPLPSVAGSQSTPSARTAARSSKLASASTPATAEAETGTLPVSSVKASKLIRKRRAEAAIKISDSTFADVGGCQNTLKEVFHLTLHLKCPQFYQKLQVLPPRGFLLHGPPGCGKTLLANAISGELQVPMLSVAGVELISGVSGDSEGKIRELFEQAKAAAPCILFIDGIDVIAKRRENAQKDMELRIVSQLLMCLDSLNAQESQEAGQIFVIGATSRLESIEPGLRIGGRLDSEVAMGIPDEKARKHILEVMCRHFNFEAGFDFQLLARLTPGYVGSDLDTLVRKAAKTAVERHLKVLGTLYGAGDVASAGFCADSGKSDHSFLAWASENDSAQASLDQLCLTFEDFKAAHKLVLPSALKEGFATVPNVSFDDIGALDDLREELEMAICAPVHDPEVIEKLGMDVPSGVLLCGPPGCGKTLLAKAVANQAGINFISVKGPEIINMYVGESERAIRQVFQRARNSAPCVIFFDEIDSICPRRSGHDGGSGSNRVVNQLLTEMDGVEARKGVYVMGATNRIDMIDQAVLRPGRLTNHFFVDLPTAAGRVDILRKLTRYGTKPRLATDVDLSELGASEKCEGFTGADLGKLVLRASHFRFKEFCKDRAAGKVDSADEVCVAKRHFERALEVVKPSISGTEKKRYDVMKKRFAMYNQLRDVDDVPINEEDEGLQGNDDSLAG